MILCLLPQVLFAAPKSTQGQFAVKLVEKLGIAGKVSEEKAIEILSSRSIYPGSPFEVRWDKDREATEKFIAQIQASLQVLLKRVAVDLDIPPPPTLELFIFELPPAPQRAYFQKASDTHSETSEDSIASVSGPPPDISSSDMEPPPNMKSPAASSPPPDAELPPDSGAPPGMEEIPMSHTEMKMPTSQEKVDRAVLSTLSRQDRAAVIVVLNEPKRKSGDSQEQRVARAQQSVLDTLSPEEFKLKRRFDVVFSFAGWVNIDGFMKLQVNSEVKQIVLDELARPQ